MEIKTTEGTAKDMKANKCRLKDIPFCGEKEKGYKIRTPRHIRRKNRGAAFAHCNLNAKAKKVIQCSNSHNKFE